MASTIRNQGGVSTGHASVDRDINNSVDAERVFPTSDVQAPTSTVPPPVLPAPKVYFVAPGAAPFQYRDQGLAHPSDGEPGTDPLHPLASLAGFVAKLAASQAPGIALLMIPGNYALPVGGLELSQDYSMIVGPPGYARRSISLIGAGDGADCLKVTGRGCHLEGFDLEADDAAARLLVVQGRYTTLRNLVLTTGGDNKPAAGLVLKPKATVEDASFVKVEDCEITDVDVGILFDFTAGDYPGSTNCWLENVRLRRCTTRYIAQHASSWINGVNFKDCSFGLKPASEFVKLDTANNGNDEVNIFEDCVFADDAIAAPGDVALTNTATAFKVVGCRDKAGFITSI